MYSVLLTALAFATAFGAVSENRPNSMFNADVDTDAPKKEFNVDDWLALPEVFSKLDFTADNTPAADDDFEGQEKLRASRYWGRMYIEGHPQSIQYFRAHFGEQTPKGKKYFVFANSRDACSENLVVPKVFASVDAEHEVDTKEIVLLAHRGTCTFGVKALNAHAAGVSGLIIINNEPGLEHHPSPDTHDIELSVTSISQPEGILLEGMYDNGAVTTRAGIVTPLVGYLVPITCPNAATSCIPTTVEEKGYVNSLAHGGVITMYTGDKVSNTNKMEYILAYFGVKMPTNNQHLEMALANPAEACDALVAKDSNQYKGKVILVRRGGCPFVRKAEMVQSAGGAMMLVGSNHPYLVRMGVEPRWKGLSISIPIAMVSKSTYSELFAQNVVDSSTTVSFQDTNEVSGELWETLEKLYNGEVVDMYMVSLPFLWIGLLLLHGSYISCVVCICRDGHVLLLLLKRRKMNY